MSSGADVRASTGVPVLADFAGQDGTPFVIDKTTGYGYTVKDGDIVVPVAMGGSVTSVAATPPSGLLGISGSPITGSGTFAFAWSVSQGAIPYASGTNTLTTLAKTATASYLDNSGTSNNPAWVAKAALTRNDDTNVTLTLGGSPTVALLAATSITVAWAGQLGLSRGGTASNLSATGGSGQVLKQTSVGGAVTVATVAASEIASPAALSKTDDTNVTLTLGGSPTVALLASASIAVGWTGTLSVARGGTGNAGTASAWTPADNSGAGLTFTGVVANYQRIGNMVFAYASFTYPATADGTAASITGLPVTVPNRQDARQGQITYTNSAVANKVIPTQNTVTAGFFTAAGAAVTNAQMSTSVVYLMFIYPAV